MTHELLQSRLLKVEILSLKISDFDFEIAKIKIFNKIGVVVVIIWLMSSHNQDL